MLPQKLTKIYSHKIKNQSDIINRSHLKSIYFSLLTTEKTEKYGKTENKDIFVSSDDFLKRT